MTTKKATVHQSIYDSKCRVNKRARGHQKREFRGQSVNLEKGGGKKTLKMNTSEAVLLATLCNVLIERGWDPEDS